MSVKAQDITGIVVGPGIGLAFFLVILPDQLICRVIAIGGRIRTVRNCTDITVFVIGVAVGNIITSAYCSVGGYLCGGSGGRRGGRRQGTVLCLLWSKSFNPLLDHPFG